MAEQGGRSSRCLHHLFVVGEECDGGLLMSVTSQLVNHSLRTAEALQSLGCHAPVLPDVVGTQLIQNTRDRDGVCQQLCRLAHLSVLVQRVKVSGVHVCIPTCHVDQNLLHLGLRKLELLEETPTSQIMVVFVDLFQNVADLQMRLVVVGPVLFTAVYWYTTVWTLEIYMGGWGACLG